MAIKDLLVAYDGNENARKAVQFAAQMAKKYGASLTGLHVYKAATYESQYSRWIPDSVLENIHDAERTAEGEIEKAFQAEVKAAGIDGGARWISCQAHPEYFE